MSQAKPGRAKVSQDEPKRRGGAKQSQGVHGEFWRVLLGLGASSGEFCWDLELVLASSAGTWSEGVGRMSQAKP